MTSDPYHSPTSLLLGITSPSEALHLATTWLDGYAAEGEDYDYRRRRGTGASSSSSSSSSHPPPPEGEEPDDDDGCAAAAPPSSSGFSHPVADAIAILTELRDRVSRDGLVSDNEALDDVPTSTLELLGAEYHLGRARLLLPAADAPLRRRNVSLAICDYLSFLRRLEMLGEGMLEDATLVECRRLLDAEGGGGRRPRRRRRRSDGILFAVEPLRISRHEDTAIPA